MERKNLWSSYSEEQLTELEKVSEKYRTCLDMGKTERECVRTAIALAKEAGNRSFSGGDTAD